MHQVCYWGDGLLMWQKLLHMKRWYMEWKVSQMNLKVFVIYSPATSEEMSWNMIEDSGERLKGEWKLLFQKVIIIATYLPAFLLLYFPFSFIFLPSWEIRMGCSYTWKISESHVNFSVHVFCLQEDSLRIWLKREIGRHVSM